MAHHASTPAEIGGAWHGDDSPRESVPEALIAPAVRDACDQLFRDADRHGPRWPTIVRRAVPALALLCFAAVLAAAVPWRTLVIGFLTPDVADAAIVAPVLGAIVVLAAALAPLARVRTEWLLGSGLVLIAASSWIVGSGLIAAAAVPASVAALLLGIAAARAVSRAVWMLPVLMAAGISDAQSVGAGMTNELLAGTSTVRGSVDATPTLSIPVDQIVTLDYLVLHIPAASGVWLLGLVDVLAIGMLLGLAHLNWLPLPRTAMALALALVLTLGMGIPVPVLPMFGAAWLVVHARLVWRATRFSLRRLTYLGG